MLNKYNNKAYESYKKITNDIQEYYANELYHNEKHDIYFFVNSKGYLHVYDIDKKSITELMLTKDNELKFVSDITPLTETQKRNMIERLKEATPV